MKISGSSLLAKEEAEMAAALKNSISGRLLLAWLVRGCEGYAMVQWSQNFEDRVVW